LFGKQPTNIKIDLNDIIVKETGEGYIPQILQKNNFSIRKYI
jgi:hypothetical protein